MNILTSEEAEIAKVCIDEAARIALKSPCLKSQRGVVIYSKQMRDALGLPLLIGSGYNSPPQDICCKSCLRENDKSNARYDVGCRSIHAEMRAINNAIDLHRRHSLVGATMYHAKVKNGIAVPSGSPSCASCSKAILDERIGWFVMWQKIDGAECYVAYDADEFNRLSFEYHKVEF